jgi:protein SCO1
MSRQNKIRPLLSAMIATILAIAGLGYYWVKKNNAGPLDKMGVLPGFSFKDQRDQSIGSDNFKGKIWVANFIFTRCPTVCPRLSKIMAKVQKQTEALGDKVQLVSFSVDPEFDKPPVLAAFAKKFGAGPRWSFLTGDVDNVKKTVVEGLKIGVERGKDKNNIPDITHGTHFVLMDAGLTIRGYYRVEEPAAYEKLLVDLQRLADGL